jgi:hypothetical protein
LILDYELVIVDFVLNNVIELEIVVRDSLSAKHNHGISVHHMETNEPDLSLGHNVDDLPVSSLLV